MGGQLRGEAQLPLLLHLHRVTVLPDGVHFRLRDHTLGAKYAIVLLRFLFNLNFWLYLCADVTVFVSSSGAQGGKGLVFALQESPGRYPWIVVNAALMLQLRLTTIIVTVHTLESSWFTLSLHLLFYFP